jgi:hypothetical protein
VLLLGSEGIVAIEWRRASIAALLVLHARSFAGLTLEKISGWTLCRSAGISYVATANCSFEF